MTTFERRLVYALVGIEVAAAVAVLFKRWHTARHAAGPYPNSRGNCARLTPHPQT